MDTSWEIHWGKSTIIIDPWLVGSEIDYFSWFNEQWHTSDPVSLDEINTPDIILISQSYSDHCHEETLRLFSDDVPILASPKAYQRLKKSLPDKRLTALPVMSKDGFLDFEGLKIATIDPGRWMDPIYYSHVISNGSEAIFYSSHGFELSSVQIDLLKPYRFSALMTSFSQIELPSILGGKVNPGIENVKSLIDQLNPTYLMNTHDEKKEHSGLVMKLAKTKYPSLDTLSFSETNFLNIDDYAFREINGAGRAL